MDTAQARAVGALIQQGGEPGRDIAATHVVHGAKRRAMSADPGRLRRVDPALDLDLL